MNKLNPTLAIYGIQDRADSDYPFFVHDHNITLMQNGRVIKYLQLERKTRNKHDNKLHKNIYALLKEAKLIGKDIDLVFVDNVVGRTFISEQGSIRFEAPLNTNLENKLEEGRCWWFDKSKKAYALNHELAHIASCLPFYGNFKENSLLIHFDGGGSLSNLSVWTFKDHKLEVLEYGWEFKYLSSFFNANALNFAILGAKQHEHNSVPGKLMGFASFGKYSVEIENWLNKYNYFEDIWSNKNFFLQKAKEDFDVDLKQFNLKNKFLQDIAATFQFIFQRDFINYIKSLKEKTGADYLYLTGGSSLNIVTNTQLVEEKIFNEVFIPPCCEDSGLSLGAASYVEYLKHNIVELHTPYLNNWGIEDYKANYTQTDIKQTAELLMQNKVIAICNNQAEIGPRALGNRSIIALANNKNLAQKVSIVHKNREWYRPIAPIMLKRNLSYFTNQNLDSNLGKYMLLDYEIKTDKQKEIRGVVHVNNTARIQFIEKREDNNFMFDLLDYLETQYNIKALINTSFNKKGEPIVHTEEGAVASAKNMSIDAVVLNGKLKVL